MERWRSELYHHGILGQKWGVRRYQNEDGSLTTIGKMHYQRDMARLKRYDAKVAKAKAKAQKIRKNETSMKLKAIESQKKMESNRQKRAGLAAKEAVYDRRGKTRRGFIGKYYRNKSVKIARKIEKLDRKYSRGTKAVRKYENMQIAALKQDRKAEKYSRKGEALANKIIAKYNDHLINSNDDYLKRRKKA